MSASAFVRAISLTAFLGALAVQAPAHAIPIGDFSWGARSEEECVGFGLCGAFFSVGNFSADEDLSLGLLGGSFLDVFVDLDTSAGAVSLSLGGDIPAAHSSSQSIDDVSGPAVLFAGLRLTFSVPGLPGSVRLLDAEDNVVAGLSGPGFLLIDYAVDDVVTVPEPSTLLLLAGGLIGIVAERKVQRPAPPTSRMKRSSGHGLPT